MKICFLYITLGASLMACSSRFIYEFKITAPSVQEDLNSPQQVSNANQLQLFLLPYQDTLHQEFDAVLATTPTALFVSRPSSNLMNWCADALLSSMTSNKRLSEPVICILNTGGLRSSFGKGPLTLADFYKLMPFDNTVTWVHLPVERLPQIEKYLNVSGGEPIANCVFRNGSLEIPNLLATHNYVWVLTSDYLANGGDQMSFFKDLEKQESGVLLRDVFIAQAKNQGVLVLDTLQRYFR
jgi:2',3'-cyclic-nucleotide 2'-phosphodiesterase (5'-nucleotidase family)